MPQAPPQKLLDHMRDTLCLKHDALRTETAFLTHLAVEGQVTASTQNQALSALLFPYRYVLHIDLDESIALVQAKKPRRLPTVLTKAEA